MVSAGTREYSTRVNHWCTEGAAHAGRELIAWLYASELA